MHLRIHFALDGEQFLPCARMMNTILNLHLLKALRDLAIAFASTLRRRTKFHVPADNQSAFGAMVPDGKAISSARRISLVRRAE